MGPVPCGQEGACMLILLLALSAGGDKSQKLAMKPEAMVVPRFCKCSSGSKCLFLLMPCLLMRATIQ